MKKGVAAPTVFLDEARELGCVVQGGDFTFVGWQDFYLVAEYLRPFYELKVCGVVGGGPEDIQDVVILNRRLTWNGNVMTYEADPKRAEMVCDEVGLEDRSKGLERPCVQMTAEELEDEELNCPLAPAEARELGALAARANQLAIDRPDVQLAVKEARRDMAAPPKAS